MQRQESGVFYVLIRCRKCRTESEVHVGSQVELDQSMAPGGRFDCPECDGAGDLLGIFSEPAEPVERAQ